MSIVTQMQFYKWVPEEIHTQTLLHSIQQVIEPIIRITPYPKYVFDVYFLNMT